MSRARRLGADVLGLAIAAVLVAATLAVVRPVKVEGGSMHPALHAGDLVVVQRGCAPAVGDVVLFRLDGDRTATLHRVVGSQADGLVTRGDANPTTDRRCA